MSEDLSIGIEEEYLLVDPESRALAKEESEGFMDACKALVGERVTHEFLQSQVEIGTGVCETISEARSELTELREAVASVAQAHGLALIAASTHPWTHWHDQQAVDKDRYRAVGDEVRSLADRMAICGMHVHAGIADEDLRIDLMNQATYFLPHLLALSVSSPFWQGRDTGLKSFRTTIINDLPRSGLPEVFESWSDWQRLLRDLHVTGMVTDPSKIWWDLRPSSHHPTLEMRICDVCTSMEDALCIAALYQSLLAYLANLRAGNHCWRAYRRTLIRENKWHAQRDGTAAELGDFGRSITAPLPELIDELVELVRPHAELLGCIDEVERAGQIARRGTSADRQLALYRDALKGGASERQAQVAVVDWLIEASRAGATPDVFPGASAGEHTSTDEGEAAVTHPDVPAVTT